MIKEQTKEIVKIDQYNQIVYVKNGKKEYSLLFGKKYIYPRDLVHYSNGDVFYKGKKFAVWYHTINGNSFRDEATLISPKNYNLKHSESLYHKYSNKKNKYRKDIFEIVNELYKQYGDHYIIKDIKDIDDSYSAFNIKKYGNSEGVSYGRSSSVSNKYTDKIIFDKDLYNKLIELDDLSSNRYKRSYKIQHVFTDILYKCVNQKNHDIGYVRERMFKISINGRKYYIKDGSLINDAFVTEISENDKP